MGRGGSEGGECCATVCKVIKLSATGTRQARQKQQHKREFDRSIGKSLLVGMQ